MADPSLLETVRHALAHPVTAEEDDAWRRPPYPTPAGWRDAEAAMVAVARAAPPEVADRPVVLGVLATPDRLASRVRRSASRPTDLLEVVAVLVGAGALDADDVETLVREHPVDDHTLAVWRRQSVLVALADGDVGTATRAADAVGDRYAFMGHRDIGAFHAARGDAPAFLAGWSKYRAGSERVGMDRIKQALVRGVAARDGWSAAVTMARDQRLGPKYAAGAFAPWAATGDVLGLLAVFADEAAGLLGALDELEVLTDALVAAAPRRPDTDVDGLATVFARLRAVDPTTDKATMRRRDLQLSRLWPAIGETETLQAVRAAIRTPRLRAEHTRLARDVR